MTSPTCSREISSRDHRVANPGKKDIEANDCGLHGTLKRAWHQIEAATVSPLERGFWENANEL
jgi:hypothetical protein